MQIKNSNKILMEFKQTEKLMGNMFEITVVADSKNCADNKIALAISEIKRIETLLSNFRDNSQTNLINNNAGITDIVVDKEVLELIKRSIKISEITDGAFDLTYGSLDKSLWNFDKTMAALPTFETATEMVKLINYKNILVNDEKCSVYLKNKGMRIGFGGIGKGYAAEMAKAILIKAGVKSGIVNAAGDLTAWGTQANGNAWTVGIADPNNVHLPFSYLSLSNMAIATSGNYEKYVIINGKKYSHTINPKTGLPVTGIKSVTTISPNAEIADAMATPITIMGIKAGIDLVNQIDQLECIIIDDFNKIYSSKNINLK